MLVLEYMDGAALLLIPNPWTVLKKSRLQHSVIHSSQALKLLQVHASLACCSQGVTSKMPWEMTLLANLVGMARAAVC